MKTVELSVLARKLHSWHSEPKVVLCHGCFDLLHIGHIRHLQAAWHMGNCLVVTVTADEYVNKGPGRPLFTAEQRAEALAALHCVDYVSINKWPTAVEAIRLLRPHILCKGADNKDNCSAELLREEQAVLSVGGRLEFTESPVLAHSSDLLEAVLKC